MDPTHRTGGVWRVVRIEQPMRDHLLNITGLGGFGLLAVGLWWYNPWTSLSVCGSLMLACAVYGILKTRRER